MKPLHSIDFNYIFSHCDASKFEIPYYYDRQNWKPGQTYKIRISSIYDPSKFWVVVKDRELDIFVKFLTDFYNKYGNCYKMSLNTVSRNIYCTVFTDNAFYRGIIINIPHSFSLEKKAVVFLFDFGYISTVNVEDLYYLAEKFYEVPRFAVRASLSYLQPHNNYIWSYELVKRFDELVSKKLLLCILECTDPNRKIIIIRIGNVNEFSHVTDIGDILIREKLAEIILTKQKSKKVNDNSRYAPKTKYPYLFPSFEAIESGIVPSSVYISELLGQCVPRDVLFKPYFKYKGTSKK